MSNELHTDTENKGHRQITENPNDVVSCVQYLNTELQNAPNLLVSSWDSTVRLYKSSDGSLVSSVEHKNSPILAATSMNPSDNSLNTSRYTNDYFVSGGLSCEVFLGCFSTKSIVSILGSHSGPIKCVEFEAPDLVVTGSWDKTVKTWDLRSSNSSTKSIEVNGKVFAIATAFLSNKLVICDSTKSVYVYDRRNLDQPLYARDSTNPILKTQIRAATCFPDGSGFTLASVEGRVAWECFNNNESTGEKKNYAFKCHREKNSAEGGELIYPVNSIAFHKKFLGFATGGGDGLTIIWDGFSKKRLWKCPEPYKGSVTSLAFHPDLPELAIGTSEGMKTDIRANIPGAVYIRSLSEIDVTPKTNQNTKP